MRQPQAPSRGFRRRVRRLERAALQYSGNTRMDLIERLGGIAAAEHVRGGRFCFLLDPNVCARWSGGPGRVDFGDTLLPSGELPGFLRRGDGEYLLVQLALEYL